MLLIGDEYRYLLIVGFCFFSLSHWCFKIAVNFLLGFSRAGLCQKHIQGTKGHARPQQEDGPIEQTTSERLRARECEDCRYSRWQMSIEISERSLFTFFRLSVVVCPRKLRYIHIYINCTFLYLLFKDVSVFSIIRTVLFSVFG